MLDSDVKSVIDKYIDKKINRRSFLITAGIFTGSVSLGSVLSYIYKNTKIKHPYNRSQDSVVFAVHNHLFPKGDDSPCAADANSVEFFTFCTN